MQTTKQFTYRTLEYIDLSLVKFELAWLLQKHLFQLRLEGKINDTLLLLEHPNTYTLGKTADTKNVIAENKFIEKNDIEIFEIDRGGDVTYHGPGQIVGYAIINLSEWEKDSHKYLRALEEVIIKTCNEFGVDANRNTKYTGVWANNNKICAIGIKISRWITMHGFAFNVNTDLDLFGGIIPCGISDKGVTSLEKEIKRKTDLGKVKNIILKNFAEVFNYNKILFSTASENYIKNSALKLKSENVKQERKY